MDDGLRIERHGPILRVDSGDPPQTLDLRRRIFVLGAFAATIAGIIYLSHMLSFASGYAIAFALGIIAIWSGTYGGPRRRITEIDIKDQRLTISKRSGQYTITVVDRPLGMCSSFGTVRYAADGRVSYCACVEWKDGQHHAITFKKDSPSEAAWVTSQVAAATGFPVQNSER